MCAVSFSVILEVQVHPLLPCCMLKGFFFHTELESLVPQVSGAAVWKYFCEVVWSSVLWDW